MAQLSICIVLSRIAADVAGLRGATHDHYGELVRGMVCRRSHFTSINDQSTDFLSLVLCCGAAHGAALREGPMRRRGLHVLHVRAFETGARMPSPD